MSKLHDIYQRLRTIPDQSVDLSLAAALPTADSLSRRLIGLSLLERRHPDGLLSLVNHFHILGYDVQEALVRQVADFHHALRVASECREGDPPANIIQIVLRAKALRLGYLLVDLLRYGSTEVRAKAAACLLELSRGISRDEGDASPSPHDTGAELALANTLAEALTLYRHHAQPDVLLAISTLAPRAMPGILRIMQDRTNPAVRPMRTMLEAGDSVEVRRSLLMWVRVLPLTSAALIGLQKMHPSGIADVLHSAHLLPMASVQRALARLPAAESLCPQADQLDDFPPAARRGLPHWIMALPLEPTRQVEALSRLGHDADRYTRLAALRQLMAIADGNKTEAADGVISIFCTDADATVARIALRHLVFRRWPGLAKLLVNLVNSPHEDVRHLAGAHLAPLGFARFWDAWPRLSYAQQLAGGQALIKLDPHFHRLLGERLGRPERAGRLRAMAVIFGLNQGAFFETPLLTLARDDDEVIASAAVRALGSGSSPAVVEALELALRHNDARVRANAVESLQQIQSTRHVHKLVEMAHDEESRPRVNAIHALMEMRTGEAMASLNNMLADQRPAQRVSALWLVDHLGVVEMARQVAELSIADPDPKVKDRAASVIKRLIESLHPPEPSDPAPPAAVSQDGTVPESHKQP